MRIGLVREAQLEDSGSGLTPVTQGWFVVSVRDAEWWFAETRGARCAFENEYGASPVEFDELGINITVLEPGQRTLYHAEANEEAFLVVAGECALLVEGEERRLQPWDFLHAPPSPAPAKACSVHGGAWKKSQGRSRRSSFSTSSAHSPESTRNASWFSSAW